jgi:hypothetical protein
MSNELYPSRFSSSVRYCRYDRTPTLTIGYSGGGEAGAGCGAGVCALTEVAIAATAKAQSSIFVMFSLLLRHTDFVDVTLTLRLSYVSHAHPNGYGIATES